MRVLKTENMRVVHAGLQWPHPDIDPSTKEAMKHLERNEALVTWVQPIGGSIDDQFPTIHVRDGVYYVLSLRSMKIVFRHIRLCKGFVNRERTVYGEWKLRIPMCLLREKVRTQMRFNALRNIHMADPASPQSAPGKAATNATQKIISFIHENVLAFDPVRSALQQPLSFVPREEDTLNNMMDLVQSECPRLLRSESYFVAQVHKAYRSRVHDYALCASDT